MIISSSKEEEEELPVVLVTPDEQIRSAAGVFLGCKYSFALGKPLDLMETSLVIRVEMWSDLRGTQFLNFFVFDAAPVHPGNKHISVYLKPHSPPTSKRRLPADVGSKCLCTQLDRPLTNQAKMTEKSSINVSVVCR